MKKLFLSFCLLISPIIFSMEGDSVTLAKEDLNSPRYFQFLAKNGEKLGTPIAIGEKTIELSPVLQRALLSSAEISSDHPIFSTEISLNDDSAEKVKSELQHFFEKLEKDFQKINDQNKNTVLKKIARTIAPRLWPIFNLLDTGFIIYAYTGQEYFFIQTPENQHLYDLIFGTKENPTPLEDIIKRFNAELETRTYPNIGQEFLWRLAFRIIKDPSEILKNLNQEEFNKLVTNYLNLKINLKEAITHIKELINLDPKNEKTDYLSSLISDENIKPR